jgi:hypothetical protein
MSDTDLIIHILANLPEEYESTVELLEGLMSDKSNPLTIETVRERLNARFARINKSEERRSEEKALASKDILLATLLEHVSTEELVAFIKQFGKNGQNTGELPVKNESFGPQCWNCKEWGHVRADCPKLKEKEDEKAKLAIESADSDDDELDDCTYGRYGYIDELGFAVRDIMDDDSTGSEEFEAEILDDDISLDIRDGAEALLGEKAHEVDVQETKAGEAEKVHDLVEVQPVSSVAKARVEVPGKENLVVGEQLERECAVVPENFEMKSMMDLLGEKYKGCIDGQGYPDLEENTCIEDSGATCHMFQTNDVWIAGVGVMERPIQSTNDQEGLGISKNTAPYSNRKTIEKEIQDWRKPKKKKKNDFWKVNKNGSLDLEGQNE